MGSIKLSSEELLNFLNEKAKQYENSAFFDDDPIQIPARFSDPLDIEISGFLTATIAWGNRKSIINNANGMMERMDDSPADFIQNASPEDLKSLSSFVHRTFNGEDFQFFVLALRRIYASHKSLEAYFSQIKEDNLHSSIDVFRKDFLNGYSGRTTKHIASPSNGSTAKRIHMYLRWMVRKGPVDFGLWKGVSPSLLSCPVDVHSGRVARKLGLLKRTQNDVKTVLELDNSLRKLDPKDPVKFDFALFGLGVFEKF